MVNALASEPAYFVINLYTWLDDRQEAVDLALRVAASEEENPLSEPVKVFQTLVR